MHPSPDPHPSAARLLLLNAAAVALHLQADDVLSAVREAFVLHSREQGRVFPVIREALATGGVFGIKAGDVPAENLLGQEGRGFYAIMSNFQNERTVIGAIYSPAER